MGWLNRNRRPDPAGVAPGEPYVYFELQPSQGWIALPVDGLVDAVRWAKVTVAEAVQMEVDDFLLQVAVESLAAAVFDARSKPRGVVNRALAYRPDPLGRVLARLEATLLAFEGNPMSMDDVAEEVADPTDVLGGVAVERRDLGAGPALRVRRIVALDAPRFGQDGDQLLAESLTYAVLPVGLPGLLMIHAEWLDLGLGDVLASQVDLMVEHLQLDFRR